MSYSEFSDHFCTSRVKYYVKSIAATFSYRFRKCYFLFSCDTAWAVCPTGLQVVFNASKEEVTLLLYAANRII